MTASRRLRYNFALDRALEHCAASGKPLLLFEPLRVAYPWASDRLHRFVLDGMADNARRAAPHNALYFPYVEPTPGSGKGLLAALAAHAFVVVTDEFPCFFLPRMLASAARQLSVLLEAVDSNGLLPLRATSAASQRAVDFRRLLQKQLPAHLDQVPQADPLATCKLAPPPALPQEISSRWPAASPALLSADSAALAALPIDHSVTPAPIRGGDTSAVATLREFLDRKLPLYLDHRSEPEADASSGLSPFLHFGHLSVHEIFAEVARLEGWSPRKLALRVTAAKEGWWNMSPAAESFLDELITWRELGYNFCLHRADYDRYDSLPAWARKTLEDHAADPRDPSYTLEQFQSAQTADPLWNAAQTQLVREGGIHNYLRMLWGKKILQWSRSPREALDILIHLNNKYALDGRDPNSYSGIFWTLGRFDRPWAPVRPIFGSIRYMSSENTARKFSVKAYIRRYSPSSASLPF